MLASTAYLCESSHRGRLPSSPFALHETVVESSGSKTINKDVPFFIKDKVFEIGLRGAFDSDVLLMALHNVCGKEGSVLIDNKAKINFIPVYRRELTGRPKLAGVLKCSFGDRVSLEGFLRSFNLEELWHFSVFSEGSDRPL